MTTRPASGERVERPRTGPHAGAEASPINTNRAPDSGPAARPTKSWQSPLSRITKLSDLLELGGQALDDCLVKRRGYEYRQYPVCIEVVHGGPPGRKTTIKTALAGAVLAMHHDVLHQNEDGLYRHLRRIPMAGDDPPEVYGCDVQLATRQMLITSFEATRLRVLEDLFNHRLGDSLAKLDPPTWRGTAGPHSHEERLRLEALADRFLIRPTEDGQALIDHLLSETVPDLRRLGL